ncbi:MAG: YjbQ family protein [Nitrospinaceae bacterium]|nr:YjbQ family protein [Nitrospinaceae bacterium]NIR54589.1 YjbQ family protein [Nitrospinaceae bacterium]NIS85011.1 YjbQ family protein [Nitrospinaceae bacterium]NIT81822.1 YjbQ family protein [Nitrospinaceae bacterium]NIU44085.1 YjbQ family protein [Nitrospinaceae bacterium]
MTVESRQFQISSKGFGDIIDITEPVAGEVAASGVADGLATVFVPGSTAGITSIEFEPGAISDLKKAIERLAPMNLHYDHDARWGDGNGFSHVRAALMGASFTVPLAGGRLQLGTWQQIVLCDFDNRPRQREIVVQILGDV